MKLAELLTIDPSKWTDDMIQSAKLAEADGVFTIIGETDDERLVARLMRKGYLLGIGEVLDTMKRLHQ